MKYFLPLGEPSEEISSKSSPVSLSLNSSGLARVAVDKTN
ncbi:unnamed protein product [marine sediment metagenome]|uniref:Uncharacterized protein n=1 Tax=marine sediment metagenome TaxID=412755 RepID=X1N303_9ZZZZ